MTVTELVTLCKALSVGMTEREKISFIAQACAVLFDVEAQLVVPTVVKSAPKQPNQSKIVVAAGASCVCRECKKTAYRVVADVYAEGMTGEEFAACFEPQPTLPIDMLPGDDGNEMVDCPLCKAEKAVLFIRRS